jgi:WD40 repeat protein
MSGPSETVRLAESSRSPKHGDGPRVNPSLPHVPDHTLLRCIGSGSYGEVWLARNIMGTYRAIKVVYREDFDDPRPYDREYEGIQRFEPVSRTHDGLVDVLQIGRSDSDTYFYYVMELADDIAFGQQVDPDRYEAKNLGMEASKRGRLPSQESLEIGLSLSAALSHLHKNGLIHRDIKPSNIIFVHGMAKVADIGLVTQVGSTKSYVGTEGFIPPEGPGTVQADIYSLGKVLYEISTGYDRKTFPSLPTQVGEIARDEDFIELNEVVLRACESDLERRYRTAGQMHDDLLLLRAGKSVRRMRALERRVALFKRIVLVASLVLFLGALAYLQVARARQAATRRLAESFVEYGSRFQDSGDLLGALPSYAAALKLEQNEKDRELKHRVRLGATIQQSPRIVNVWSHSNVLNEGRFTPDGQGIVGAGADGNVVLWTLGSNKPVQILTASTKEIESAVLNKDGTRLLTGGSDTPARLWDLRTRTLLRSFDHLGIYSVDFSPNGDLLVTGSRDGSARLWRTNGELVFILPGHSKEVRTATFSHDGSLLLTASYDKTARLWDVRTGASRGPTLTHSNWIYAAAFSPDSRKIVTSSFDNTARIWDTETGQLLRVLSHNGPVRNAQFSPDGLTVATACWDVHFTVHFWDVETGFQVLPPLHHNDYISSLAFDSEGKRLLTVGYRGVVWLWDLYPEAKEGISQRSFFSGNGERYAKATGTEIQVFDTLGNVVAGANFDAGKSFRELRLNEDGTLGVIIATNTASSGQFTAQSVRWDNGVKEFPSFPLGPEISGWELSRNGQRLLGWGGTNLMVWETETGQLSRRFSSAENWRSALLDPTAKFVLGVSGPDVHVWSIATGSEEVLEQGIPVESVEFDRSGTFLAVACAQVGLGEGHALVWDFKKRARLGHPLRHRIDGIAHASISPDGKRIVTAGEDKIGRIWDFRTGKQTSQPLLHNGGVLHAAFSPDSEWVATSCMDGSIRVWDAETGHPITPPLEVPWGRDIYTAVQFLDSGQKVVAKRRNGSSVIWNLVPDRRKIEQVEAEAHLLSGHYSDPGQTRAMSPLAKEELLEKWEMVRSNRLESETSPSADNLVQWHLRQAERAQSAGQTNAASFHLDRVRHIRQAQQ